MKRCNNCGAQLADDAMFCGECGTKLASQNLNVGTNQPMQQGYPQQSMQQGYPQQLMPQAYLQQPMQQGYPQQPILQKEQPKFIPPTYPEGTPVINIIWEGPEGSIDGINNWATKKWNDKSKFIRKTNYINIFVNGNPISPKDSLNYFDSFNIPVPITEENNTIEIRIGNKKVGDIHTFYLDPSQSYNVVIVEPSVLAYSKIFGCILSDTQGNIIAASGIAEKSKQWMSCLIPLVGFYFSFANEEAKQNKSIKKLYIMASLFNLVLIIMLLRIIL